MIVVDVVQLILDYNSFIVTFIMLGGCIFFIPFPIMCGKKHLAVYYKL